MICILLLRLVTYVLDSMSTKGFKRHTETSTLTGTSLEVATASSAVQCLTLCAGYQHSFSEICYAARYNGSTRACKLISRDGRGEVQWIAENQWKVFVSKDAGCNDGWHSYENSSYFLSTDKLTWHDAQDSCQNLEASLAVAPDEAEDEFVWNLITSNQTHAWLGALDEDLEGSWLFVIGADWNLRSGWRQTKFSIKITVFHDHSTDGKTMIVQI